MFYEPALNNHGLPFNPYKSIVVPRAIGWISTIGLNGVVNLAPYSQFTNLGYDPPYVMFSSSTRCKDSARNASETGEFVVNMATWDLRRFVNATSAEFGPDSSEPDEVGLEMAPSVLVRAPRVARSPVHLECRHHNTIVLPCDTPGTSVHAVIGRVVGVHIADDALTPEGKLDVVRLRPLARLGYYDYTTVDAIFSMDPPPEIAIGLEGRTGRARGGDDQT